MSRYIRPPSLVKEQGRKIKGGMSWAEAQAELQEGERLAGLMKGPRGEIAAIIAGEPDFREFTKDGFDIYIISEDLASQAS